MTWHWYVARDNELFVDMDRFAESILHVRKRLQGAIECKTLLVEKVSLFESITPNHCHMIVTLQQDMDAMRRYAWEMLLHGDIYRAAANIMRESFKVPAPDILISRTILHREHDDSCECTGKHIRKVMESCPAALRLRGSGRNAVFFGKPSKNPCTFV